MNLRRRWVKSSALFFLFVGCGPNVDVLSTRDAGVIEPSVGGSEGFTTGGSEGFTTGGSEGFTTGGSEGFTTGSSEGFTTGSSEGFTTGGSASAGTAGAMPVSTGGAPVDDSTLVTLERTGCYGYCPIYSLSIRGDGQVSYQGERFVRLAGPASTQVSVQDVQSLVDLMMQENYFSLSVPDECPSGTTDMPSANTSLTLNGQTHSVKHYHGNPCAPTVLNSLEDSIDATAQSDQWVKAATGTSPTLCECQEITSPCPNDESPCVTCANTPLPAECSECPPTSKGDGQSCNTPGLYCQYNMAWCDCVTVGSGAQQWDCRVIIN